MKSCDLVYKENNTYDVILIGVLYWAVSRKNIIKNKNVFKSLNIPILYPSIHHPLWYSHVGSLVKKTRERRRKDDTGRINI